jgi:hypothetical protein
MVTVHTMPISNLQAATMYRYATVSVGSKGSDTTLGYFITRSSSPGSVTIWFNHTVDTTISTGIPANGKTNFLQLIKSQIDKASHSIDITLWEFNQLDSVAQYLIRAKKRGVKIRFVYNHLPDSPQIDTLRSKFGIQKTDNMAHILNVGGVRMEVYFAPTDSIGDTLVSLFTGKPMKSVYFCMLKFVFPSIEAALHEEYLNGIQA